jgi:hypothetical protein
VIAAAKLHFRVSDADGGVAEEDPGGDLLDVVELHLGRLFALAGVGGEEAQRQGDEKKGRAGERLHDYLDGEGSSNVCNGTIESSGRKRLHWCSSQFLAAINRVL